MPFAAATLVSFSVFLALFWTWGTFAPRQLPAPWRLAFGLAACAVAATVAFHAGLSIANTGRILAAAGLAGALRSGLAWSRAPHIPHFREALVPIVVAAFILLPAALGGLQFALFQGNIYDQFNYLASSVVRVTESSDAIRHATPADFHRIPLLTTAHLMADARPAVVDLYAAFEGMVPGELHRAHYGYLAALVMVAFGCIAEFVRRFGGGSVLRNQIVAAAFCLGFWGQLLIDLNAWSWTSTVAVNVAAAGLALQIAEGENLSAPRARWAAIAALGILAAASFHLYLEALTVIGPGILLTALFVAVRRGTMAATGRSFLWAMLIAVLAILPRGAALLGFAMKQAGFAPTTAAGALDWMWQAITGPAGSGFERTAAWFAAPAGLAWLPVSVILKFVLFGAALTGLILWLRRRERPASGESLGVLLVILGSELVLLGITTNAWLTAKAISYAAPFLLPALLAPSASGRLEGWRIPAWLLCGLHLGLGMMRPASAFDQEGIHYRNLTHYPAVTDPVLKSHRRWALDLPPSDLHTARKFKIDVPDVWLESYASMCVQAQGRPYLKVLPIYSYWGLGDVNHGRQKLTPDYDGLVYLEPGAKPGAFQLCFAERSGRIHSHRPGARFVRIHHSQPLDTLNGMLLCQVPPGREPGLQLEIESTVAGPYVLELKALPAPDASGRLLVQDAASGRLLGEHTLPGGSGAGASVLRTPLTLPTGRMQISVTLESAPASAGRIVPLLDPVLLPGNRAP